MDGWNTIVSFSDGNFSDMLVLGRVVFKEGSYPGATNTPLEGV